MSTTGNLSFERLKGQENYSVWKIGAKAYLTAKGHWSYVTKELSSSASAADIISAEKALAELTLLIDPSLYSHIEDAESAKGAWDALKNVYEDKGTSRKVSMLKQWITLKLVDCDSMQDYVNKSITLRGRVKNAGFEINEDIAGSILLCGLSEDYKPMIMSMEVKEKLTLDYVKNTLLQSVDSTENGESAMWIKNKKKAGGNKKKPVKCYDCKGPHFRNKCPNKKQNAESCEVVLFCETSQVNNNSELVRDNFFEKSCENKCNSDVFYTALATSDRNNYSWVVDTGATRHMTKDNYDLKNAKLPTTKEVRVANNETIKIDRVGDLKCKIGQESTAITLSDVHYIPKLCVNLLSISQIVKKGFNVIFDMSGVRIYGQNNKNLIASGKLIDGLFYMNIELSENAYVSVASKSDDILWHRRLGHTSYSTLKMVLDIKQPDMQCIVCAKGKHSRKPFNEKGTRATELLQIIHSDVCGPMTEKSHSNNKYFVTFIDDYSRRVFVYCMKSKGEVFAKFVQFKAQAENETDKKIKIVRTDNGTEFVNKNFHDFFAKYGIVHETSAPYSPQQNGLSERMNRTIIEKARCMLFDAELNKGFWAEAVHAAVNVINVLPNASTKKAPNEIWHNKKCNLDNFKVFGCKAMVWQPNQKRTKLDEKSYECIFLRYADNSKAYRLYDMNTRKIVISRDVIFMEDRMNEIDADKMKNSKQDFARSLIDDDVKNDDLAEISEPVNDIVDAGGIANNESTINQQENQQVNANDSFEFQDANNSSEKLNETTKDAGAHNTSRDDPTFTTRAKIDENARRPVTRSHVADNNDDLLMGCHVAYVADEPQSYKQALDDRNCDNWKTAMGEEFNSLIKNDTWELVNRPLNTSIVDNKWVFKIKSGRNNSPDIYKARLVARGFTQEYGINYYETFSPVVRFTSIRTILAIAAQKRMNIRQFDVKTAFLNGDLNETVYMEQPIGFSDGTNRVCRLKKSLYGLKQASRCWNQKFTDFIRAFGFSQCKADSCVFVSREKKKLIILAIHVDDGLIVGEDANEINRVILHLREKFEIKDTNVDCFLGLEINKNSDGSIFLHQTTYTKKVLEKFGMTQCNGVVTPSDPNQTMCDFDGSDRTSFPYRELIGSLMYLAVGTRADIAHAVGMASRYVEAPTVVHEQAAKRILKYLNKHLNFGILFQSSDANELLVYTDADYAGDIDTRRSTSGSAFVYGNGIISWSSTRQKCVSHSTTESEYIAASLGVRELTWLDVLFYEILGTKLSKITLFMDNQSAIRLIKNPEFHKRTKHIDVAYHSIREKYEEGLFDLEYISTKEMLADIFTKALAAQVFHYLTTKLGITAM